MKNSTSSTKKRGHASTLFSYFMVLAGAASLISLSHMKLGTHVAVHHHVHAPLVPQLTEWKSDALDRYKRQHPQLQILNPHHQLLEQDEEEEQDTTPDAEEIFQEEDIPEQAEDNEHDPTEGELTGGGSNKKQRRRPKETVLYAIAVTECEHEEDVQHVFYSAAVLAESIKQNSIRRHASADFEYSLYAFVHDDARECNAPLYTLGFTVLNGKSLLEGRPDFIQLYALSLTNANLVVALPVHAMILQPLDAVLELVLQDKDAVLTDEQQALLAKPHEEDKEISLVYSGTTPQSFVLVAKPDQELYGELASKLESMEEDQLPNSFADFMARQPDATELAPCHFDTTQMAECETVEEKMMLATFYAGEGEQAGCPVPHACIPTDTVPCPSLQQTWHELRLQLDHDLGNAVVETSCTADHKFVPIEMAVVNPDHV